MRDKLKRTLFSFYLERDWFQNEPTNLFFCEYFENNFLCIFTVSNATMSTARPPQPLAVSQLAATTAITNIQYPLEQHLRRHIPIGQATMALVNKDDKEEDHVNRWTFIFDNNLLSVKMSTKDAKLVERLQMELQYRGALVISASRLPHFSQFVTFQRQVWQIFFYSCICFSLLKFFTHSMCIW